MASANNGGKATGLGPMSQRLADLSSFFKSEVEKFEKEKAAKDYREIHTPKPVKHPQEKPASPLVSRTQNAVEESLVFPTQPLIHLLHQEALDHLAQNQVERAALTLLEHQSTTIRHQAINRHNKRLNAALAASADNKVKPDKNLPPEVEELVPLVASVDLNGPDTDKGPAGAAEAARCGPIDEMTASKAFRNRHKPQLGPDDPNASPIVVIKAANLNNNNPSTPPKEQEPSSDDDMDEIEKNILDFKSTRDESGADLLRMMRDDLPSEWRLVQLTVEKDDQMAGGRFKIEPRDEPILDNNFGLLVVTAQCGVKTQDKDNKEVLNVVRVPAVDRGDCPTIMKEMHDIVILHTRMFKSEQVSDAVAESGLSQPETDPAKAKRAKAQRHRQLKEEVDTRVGSLIDTLENKWLGFAKVLLLGKPIKQEDDPESVKRESDLESAVLELTREFFAADSDFVASGRRQVLRRLIDGSSKLKSEQMASGLLYVLNRDETRLVELAKRFDEVIGSRTSLKNPVQRHPVVLVLDRHIQQLPWESLPCLQTPPQPVSRIPSASFLCALAANHTRSKTSISKTGVRQDKIFYVLNPDQNLSATQKKLEGELTSLGSEGRVGEHPSLPEMKRVLSEMDAFMYCGHGTSAKSMPENEVEKMRVRALPLLFGCRSGQMCRLGRSLDPIGMASSYLIASAPAILGFLWGVTDKDIDQWTVAFMQHWLGKGQDNKAGQKEFVRAVAEQRSKFARNINRGAAVVYGLPSVLD